MLNGFRGSGSSRFQSGNFSVEGNPAALENQPGSLVDSDIAANFSDLDFRGLTGITLSIDPNNVTLERPIDSADLSAILSSFFHQLRDIRRSILSYPSCSNLPIVIAQGPQSGRILAVLAFTASTLVFFLIALIISEGVLSAHIDDSSTSSGSGGGLSPLSVIGLLATIYVVCVILWGMCLDRLI